MKSEFIKPACIAVWLQCFCGQGAAQTDQQQDLLALNSLDPELQESLSLGLEVMVVSGTRTEKTIVDNPVRVDLITVEDIERQHAMELSEAVETIPGLSLRPIRGKEGTEAWLQGISANRVRVLVDGEPVSASTGSTVDLTQVSTGDVQRIEVVKGATSVLYGSSAIGGVINVITAEPEQGFHYTLNSSLGSWGEQNASGDGTDPVRQRLNLNVSNRSDSWLISGGVNARFSDGHTLEPEYWDQQGADGHKINARVAARYYASENDWFQLSHEYYDQQQHTQFTEQVANNYYDRNKQDDAERHHLAYRSFNEFNSSDLHVSGYLENYVNESLPKDNLIRYAEFDSAKISLHSNIYELGDHTLTVGADVFRETLDQYKIENGNTQQSELQGDKDTERNSIEVFFQDEINFGSVVLLPGIRWQEDDGFGTELTPKINGRWDIHQSDNFNIFFRGGVGKGYRTPNLKERFYIFDHSHLGYIVEGNPSVQPESSLSYQAGIIFTDKKDYQFDINLFRNELNDLIGERYSHNNGSVAVYKYQNYDEALTQGVELNGMVQPVEWLRLQGGYVYLDTEDKTTGQPLKDRPRHQIKAVGDIELPFALTASLIASWQSKETDKDRNLDSPSWSKFDLKLNQRLTDTLEAYFGINNITNTQRDFYNQYDNRPIEPRLIYIGFKYQH